MEVFFRPLKAKFFCQYLLFWMGYFKAFGWNKFLLLVLLRISLDVKLRHFPFSGFKFPERCFGYRISDHKLDKCTNLEDNFFLEGYTLSWMMS